MEIWINPVVTADDGTTRVVRDPETLDEVLARAHPRRGPGPAPREE